MPRKNISKETGLFFGRTGQFPIFALPKTSRVRLRARTPPFHGGDTGSNPVRGTRWDFSKSNRKVPFLFPPEPALVLHILFSRRKNICLFDRGDRVLRYTPSAVLYVEYYHRFCPR